MIFIDKLTLNERIKNKLDDYLYDEVKLNMNIDISHKDLAEILEDIIKLTLENYEIFQ